MDNIKIEIQKVLDNYMIILNENNNDEYYVADIQIAVYLNIYNDEYQNLLLKVGGHKAGGKGDIMFNNKEDVKKTKELIQSLLYTKNMREELMLINKGG